MGTTQPNTKHIHIASESRILFQRRVELVSVLAMLFFSARLRMRVDRIRQLQDIIFLL